MFGTDHACYTNSHSDTLWSSTVGNNNNNNNFQFVTLVLVRATLYCMLRVCSFRFFISNETCGLLYKWLATSPQWTACNQPDNKHSISQLQKRTCTSLFCSRRKSKDETLVASQNWGHNMRATRAFSISPASDCTYRVQFSLARDCTIPFSFFTLEYALCCGRLNILNQNRHTFLRVVN